MQVEMSAVAVGEPFDGASLQPSNFNALVTLTGAPHCQSDVCNYLKTNHIPVVTLDTEKEQVDQPPAQLQQQQPQQQGPYFFNSAGVRETEAARTSNDRSTNDGNKDSLSTRGLRVLSLFDGISGAQVALRECGANLHTFYASEVHSNCVAVTQHHFPHTIQLGDVRHLIQMGPRVKLQGAPNVDVGGDVEGVVGVDSRNNVGESEKSTLLDRIDDIDLLIAGTPCQHFRSDVPVNLRHVTHPHSKSLFHYFVEILRKFQQRKNRSHNSRNNRSIDNNVVFVLENNFSISAEERDIITAQLGVYPVR